MSPAQELESLLSDNFREAGRALTKTGQEIREYLTARMLLLASAISEPGYSTVLKAEADNVRLFIGMATVRAGDAFDERMVGMIIGGIAVGARALVGA